MEQPNTQKFSLIILSGDSVENSYSFKINYMSLSQTDILEESKH